MTGQLFFNVIHFFFFKYHKPYLLMHINVYGLLIFDLFIYLYVCIGIVFGGALYFR